MSKFTPGPWIHSKAKHPSDGEYDYGIRAEINGRGYCIAEAFGRCDTNVMPDAEANARLISAAPDLLAALEAVVRSSPVLPFGVNQQVTAAIAKATGGTGA